MKLDFAKIGHNDLRIKVEVCGLCGTDFHIFHGLAPANSPVITGHEYVGEVVEVGDQVSDDYNIGDHIAVDPNIYCGKCQYCRAGKIQFCKNLKALGVTENGGFAEYSIVPVSQAYILPKDYSLRNASFAEPLSCCIHGIDQANIKHGDSVVIVGAGTIGLIMLQLVKLSGAAKIIVVEPVLSKREMALNIGADYAFDSNDNETRNIIKDLTGGGADVVIECVGNSKAAQSSLNFPKKGGSIVVFGLSGKNDSININLQEFFHKELTLKSSLLNPFTFSRSVDMLVTGRIKVDVLHPVSSTIENLSSIFNQPRNFSVTKYQITPN